MKVLKLNSIIIVYEKQFHLKNSFFFLKIAFENIFNYIKYNSILLQLHINTHD